MKHTFSTGITVELTRVSQFVITQADATVPRPAPPIQATALGDEPNTAHPDYINAMMDYRRKCNEARVNTMIACGVKCEPDLIALAVLRKNAKRTGIELPEDDEIAYILYIAIGNADDLEKANAIISGMSLPSEERIAVKADDFKSDVEGKADNGNASAA